MYAFIHCTPLFSDLPQPLHSVAFFFSIGFKSFPDAVECVSSVLFYLPFLSSNLSILSFIASFFPSFSDYIIKEKTVLLQKKDNEGFGFVLRGAKGKSRVQYIIFTYKYMFQHFNKLKLDRRFVIM